MIHVNTNRINNFLYMYNIKYTDENLGSGSDLQEVIEEINYIIYRKILYMIDNCCMIEKDSTGITVEIDLLENRKLLEDLTNSFFTQKNQYQKS